MDSRCLSRASSRPSPWKTVPWTGSDHEYSSLTDEVWSPGCSFMRDRAGMNGRDAPWYFGGGCLGPVFEVATGILAVAMLETGGMSLLFWYVR